MAKPPAAGAPAPDFTLPSTQGTITLSERCRQAGPEGDSAGKNVLLVFYPGDDTPVCTKQLCDYRDHLGVFEDLGVDVLGINPQSLASHTKFAEKHGLSFPLLADENKEVCRSYGALNLMGMAKRALVLVGPDQTVRYSRVDLPIFHRSASELEELIEGLSATG